MFSSFYRYQRVSNSLVTYVRAMISAFAMSRWKFPVPVVPPNAKTVSRTYTAERWLRGGFSTVVPFRHVFVVVL